MAIIIKEIQVKTIIEREMSQSRVDEYQLRRIKDELYNQLKEEFDKEQKKRRDR